MPKGQYQRRSREPDFDPATLPPVKGTVAPGMIRDFREIVNQPSSLGSDPEIAEVARLLAEPVPAPPVITRESFNEWLDADAVTMPPNDRITQMTGEWAASFCDGEHSVTWLPSLDRTSLTVTLVTPYGTSELVADAGQWREADIAEALASMRVQLGV